MVAVNVAQLLQSAPGAVRRFSFSEPLPDPAQELHLEGPVVGQAELIRTSRGVLVRSEHHARAALECGRCLETVKVEVDSSFEEEFLPTTDVRTGLPIPEDDTIDADQPRIDDHHELQLDEVLRQNFLTALPLKPLCDAACPGLCLTCGKRLDAAHQRHAAEAEEPPLPDEAASPFARLVDLIREVPGSADEDRN